MGARVAACGIIADAPKVDHWASGGKASEPAEDRITPVLLVKELNRSQLHRGREIRNIEARGAPGLLPRTGVPANWWNWRTALAYEFANSNEHINAKELRAVVSAVQWRLRNQSNIGSKSLHLLDSSVVIGCVSRGRSPAASLGPILDKLNALCLAGSITLLIAYIRTEENPADEPSRLYQ